NQVFRDLMRGGRITSEEKSAISLYVGVGVAIVLIAAGVYFFFLAQKEKIETTTFDPNRPIPSDAVFKINSGITKRQVSTLTSLPANPFSVRSISSTAELAFLLFPNRFPKICSRNAWIRRTICSGRKCTPNAVTRILAMCFPIRNHGQGYGTSFTPPPSILFPSKR